MYAEKNMKKHNKKIALGNSCILCGDVNIMNGKIFHGQCVCEECVEYVCHLEETKEEKKIS